MVLPAKAAFHLIFSSFESIIRSIVRRLDRIEYSQSINMKPYDYWFSSGKGQVFFSTVITYVQMTGISFCLTLVIFPHTKN
jgi:hypothetical protein